MSAFNPATIDAVGFDLDNTLLDRNQAVHGWLGSVLGDRPDVLAEAIGYDNSGFISRPEFYNWLAERLDWATDGESVERRFQAEVFSFFEPNPDVIDFLRALAGIGIPLALLTNGDGGFQLSKFGLLGVNDIFEEHRTLATGDLGFHKPDVRAFEAMIDSLPASADRILYVGDNPENDIAGGAAAGVKTCWIQLFDEHVCETPPNLTVRSVLELGDLFLREGRFQRRWRRRPFDRSLSPGD